MRTYFRLLEYVRPYWRRVIMLFITVTIFAALSAASLTLIHPFLRIILHDGDAPVEAPAETPAQGATVQGVPIPAAINDTFVRGRIWFEDRMYSGRQRDRLLRFCAFLLGLFFLKAMFGYLQTYMTVFLEQKVLYRIRNDVYRHLQNLPLSFFEKEKTGHIISRFTNDVTTLRGAVVGVAASMIRNGLMTVIALAVVLSVSWKLTMLTFIVIPINLVLITFIGQRLKRRSFRTQAGMAELTSLLEENISGMRVVKAFNMGGYELRRFKVFNRQYMSQFLKMHLWGAVSSPTSEFLGTISIVAILWYGGNLVIGGAISAENLVLFVAAMGFVIAPVKELSKLNNTIQESAASAERVFAILDIPQEPIESTADLPPATFERSIQLDQVHFAYLPGRPVLNDISFSVAPGEVIALVGPSGAGKSTLVDLIPRFYDTTSGSIRFDDVDIREVNLRSLRDMMGIVTQEIILFNDTVRNNIAYGMTSVSDEDIASAARAANAHDFILELQQGYDTVIGERGTQLSGGQRQRISIARAILRDPQILIFDEATSALDTQSEMLVQGAIDRLLRGRTTFVIAHRLSTIQNADKILVLDSGRVREVGTHDELIDAQGTYKKLYDLQFGVAS